MVDITGTLQYQLNEIREKKFTLALLLLRSVPNTPYAYCCYYDDEDVDYMIEGIQLPEDRKASIWESETEAEQMFPATCQFAKQLNDNLLRAHTLSCATNSSEFKTYVVEWLETQSQSLFDGSEIASYGSVKSGLGNTQSSDVDLTILVAHELARQKHDVLQKLKEHFTKCSSILTHVEVVKCKFPILRMTFESNGQSVMIDMGVNNFKAIMNSQMLSAYAKIDQRLPILALAIKQWAKVNGLYGAATFGFNSFSLVLLLVHYFQSGLRSPILPILDAFNYDTSIGLRENLMKMEESHSSVKFETENTLTPVQLLLGFMDYYSRFEFEKYIVAVHTDQLHSRFNSSKYSSDYAVVIDDPCFGLNPARRVSFFCLYQFRKATKEFIKSSQQNQSDKFSRLNALLGIVDL